MKKLILIFAALVLFSCKKEENSNLQSNTVTITESDNTSIGIGDSLIAQDSFLSEFNEAADIKAKRAVLSNIKYDFDKYVSWKENENEIKKIDGLSLKLQNDNSGKNEADIYSHIKLYVEKENKLLDTLTLYKQENFAEALVAINQYFYIDKKLNIWTLSIVEEEGSISINSWKQFKIDKNSGKINLIKSEFEEKAEVPTTDSKIDSWSGKYAFKRENRDELITSFSIDIKSLNDIDIIYVGDSEKAETYKNLKAVNVEKDKIKIEFNKKYQELGIIYIQKIGNQFKISGEPISNINPGNDEYPIKKLN